MTPEQLLREAPELYASLLEEGIRLERERALAHLDTAVWYSSLREATEAIRSGMVVAPGDGLHDYYADIEDERDRLEAEAERQFDLKHARRLKNQV